MKKLTIDRLDLKGKKVLIRCDFNVPLNEKGEITDDRRIVASLPTIKKVLQDGGAAILCSHLGRPKGQVKEELRLKPVAKRLSELLNVEVKMAPDCIGPEVQKMKAELKPGEVLLLENLRFHKEETENDPEFARQLAEGCDLYINDAFGTAHRAHASTEGVTRYFKQAAAGYLIEKELKYLGQAIENPTRPFVAILGGAKISGKIDVIRNLFNKVDTLIIGGGMAYTFYKAQGYEIGKSLLEEDRIEMAGQILKEAKEKNINLLLPVDAVVADKFDNDAVRKVVKVTEIPADYMGMDIGPESIKLFAEEVSRAKTIVWNGPLGVFEMPNFETGTRKIAEAIAQATKNGAVSVIGGGDSAAAIAKFGMEDQFTHISTGGGASLEFLEGKELPGIAALTDA
ncbi:Phosphoglycerate kinase [Caldithrix abyssi DSM 13497]|uniref:Phosphoglycerate kinase n=1 Tax=Caldithrix abyssi DSM 13497 TaxID=880073 RepID=H1XQ72_CALAY|nr:phosphoglycerate kinase [Caldithrix abyssi]APF19490.1 pgk phosphoglycerate kinase [Caldithrix abyssi DSM 13497]EHO43377.1 Phosphoglycerate kinase [Caldithrix abyssi DSM 13497]